MKNVFCLSVAAVCGLCYGDVVLESEKEYSVANGVTQTISDKVTGAGSIKKSGSGTLVLSNGANDFSGGVTIEKGILNGSAAGAFGTGEIRIGAKGASAYFGTKGASGTMAFSNPISLSGGTAEGLQSYGGTDSVWSLFFLSDTRLTGPITATRNFRIRVEPVSASANPSTSGPDVTFDGSIAAADRTVYIDSYGEMIFNGAVTAENVYVSDQWSAGGKVIFKSTENAWEALYLGNGRIFCGAKNVLGGGAVSWYSTGGFEKDHALIDLQGYDQQVVSVSFWRNGKNLTWDNNRWNAGSQQCFQSSTPATLTLTGCDETVYAYAVLRDKVSLVVDAAQHAALFTQVFCHAESPTTGSLSVLNGTLRLEGSARFPNVTAVTVGANGVLSVASTNMVFGVLESLTLDEGAVLELPEGAGLQARKIIVNGDVLPIGYYTALPQVRGGQVFCVGESVQSVTWTGAGSDTRFSTAANWSEQPLFAEKCLKPTFAAGGCEAVVDVLAAFEDVSFAVSSGEGFSLVRDETAHPLCFMGSLEAKASDQPHRYVVDVPVRLAGESFTVSAAYGQTNVLKDAFSEGSVPGELKLTGGGCVVFEGTNVIDGKISTGTNFWKVSGLLATPNHCDQGPADLGKPQSINPKAVRIKHEYSEGAKNKMLGLLLENAVIEKPLFIDNEMSVAGIKSVAGTTNELRGHVAFSYENSEYGRWQPIEVEKDSELVFSGGAHFSHSFRPYGQGVTRFRTKPISALQKAGLNPFAGHVVLEVTGNTFLNVCLGYAHNKSGNTVLETAVSHAITNGQVLVGVSGGNYTALEAEGFMNSYWYTLDLNATTQRCEKIVVTKRGIVTGDYPSMIEVTIGKKPGDRNYRIQGAVNGGAGFRFAGDADATLVLTNQVFASCGDLEVVSGTMVFAHDASWLNGTNVTVAGTGTLQVGQGETFNKRFARLMLSENGKIALPQGVTQAFSEVFINERPLGAGSYTASTLPQVTGAGTLRVVGRGTFVVIR